MPFFKTTHNIFKDYGEVFDPNWMDSDTLILPPQTMWDYKRPMTIEDVDLWELIYEASGGLGIYAAWSPFAEFYMVKHHWTDTSNDSRIETFYGPGAAKAVYKRSLELGMPVVKRKVWVDDDELWMYDPTNSPELF